MTKQVPNFLIIGAMKCGTTALANYLGQHPEIYMAPRKEVHFFDRNYSKGVEWYGTHFRQATGEAMLGEATPSYMFLAEVPARMYAMLPDAKLIAILRNPVDRAYSHYWHNRTRTKREPLNFAEAITANSERLLKAPAYTRTYYSYLERGRYLEQLQQICSFYSRDQLQVIIFEEFLKDPSGAYKSICRFLEINEEYSPKNLGEKVSGASIVRSKKVKSFANKLPRPLARVIHHLNTQKNFRYPPMDQDLRAGLLSEYEQYNAALTAWLGRDLPQWQL
jgi:hypothetical protein